MDLRRAAGYFGDMPDTFKRLNVAALVPLFTAQRNATALYSKLFPLGIPPTIVIEPSVYAHPRGWAISVHATMYAAGDATEEVLVDSLIGLGAVIEGHRELVPYQGRSIDHLDPWSAVRVVQSGYARSQGLSMAMFE